MRNRHGWHGPVGTIGETESLSSAKRRNRRADACCRAPDMPEEDQFLPDCAEVSVLDVYPAFPRCCAGCVGPNNSCRDDLLLSQR